MTAFRHTSRMSCGSGTGSRSKSYVFVPQWYECPMFAQRSLCISVEGAEAETEVDGAGGSFGCALSWSKLAGVTATLLMSARDCESGSLSDWDALVVICSSTKELVRSLRWCLSPRHIAEGYTTKRKGWSQEEKGKRRIDKSRIG